MMSTSFKKDAAKPRVELVLGDFASALLEVSKVGTMGAQKYSPHGWRDNEASIEEKIERIEDAKGRHRLYRQLGEIYDEESGLLHLAHEAWNTLAHLTLELKLRKSDDTRTEEIKVRFVPNEKDENPYTSPDLRVWQEEIL